MPVQKYNFKPFGQEYSRTGLSQAANAINLLIILLVLTIQFIINKVTGASIDRGVGGK